MELNKVYNVDAYTNYKLEVVEGSRAPYVLFSQTITKKGVVKPWVKQMGFMTHKDASNAIKQFNFI